MKNQDLSLHPIANFSSLKNLNSLDSANGAHGYQKNSILGPEMFYKYIMIYEGSTAEI